MSLNNFNFLNVICCSHNTNLDILKIPIPQILIMISRIHLHKVIMLTVHHH